MRIKSFTLLFLMGIFGLFSTNLFAQDATIDPADIRYWVGEGENEVVVAISWCSYTETALAWGYRFDGDATVFQALTDIAAADSRLTVIGGAPSNITYVDADYDLTMCPNPNAQWGDPDYDIPMHGLNGLMGQNTMSAEPIHNNDFVKIGGYACSIISEDWTTISWTTEIIPATDPNAGEIVDTTISADEIKYWVGEGENEVVVAISWCSNTETAIAWGYRFDGDATVFQALNAIATADNRLTVIGDAPSNITYVDANYDLTMCPNPNAQWGDPDYDIPMHGLNGLMGQNTMSAEPIHNNDFVKIGGYACSIISDDWTTISWTTEIIPAINPNDAVNENMSNSLTIHPNPAINEAFLIVENAGVNTISVYDMQGRLVSTTSIEAMAGEQVRISTETLNGGVYFVTVSNNSAVRTAKLVVK